MGNRGEYLSNEDKLFSSQSLGYPGQGSFSLTVQSGNIKSWTPGHIQQVDTLTQAMRGMNVQVVNILFMFIVRRFVSS